MPIRVNRKYWYSGIDGAKGRKEESRFMLICRAIVECVYWIFLPIELHSSAALDHRFDFRFQEENQILPGANFTATQRGHVQLIHNLTAFFHFLSRKKREIRNGEIRNRFFFAPMIIVLFNISIFLYRNFKRDGSRTS